MGKPVCVWAALNLGQGLGVACNVDYGAGISAWPFVLLVDFHECTLHSLGHVTL